MPFTLVLPDAYPLVLLTAVGTYWLNFWQMSRVGRARGKAGVPYPLAYATEEQAKSNLAAMQFNCAQRAHQNTLEHMPFVILGIVVTGLRHPRLAVVMGLSTIIGRAIYTLGYMTGDPKKRMRGNVHYIGTLGLLLASTWTVVSFIRESPTTLTSLFSKL